MIESYPLHWPNGWPRTGRQKRAQFSTSMAAARDGLLDEIRLLGGTGVIISSNIETYTRGGQEIPYANQKRPDDCGVAVYFNLKNEPCVFACDRWNRVQDNVQAIRKTIEALRGIERWGSSEMLNRVFTGFAALPEKATGFNGVTWYGVLGYDSPNQPYEEYRTAYRRLAKEMHPDNGGSDEEMARLNWAIEQAKKTN